MTSYSHTQRSPLWWLLLAVAGVIAGVGWQSTEARIPSASLAAALAVITLTVATLTVRDTGAELQVRFGPIPLFGTSLRYDDVRSVRHARTRLIDGWGIHWLPGRGWTFNLWGRDCVEVTLSGRRLRIGTDDPEGLAAFLTERAGIAAG